MPQPQTFIDGGSRLLETCLIVDDDNLDRRQMRQAIQRDRPDMQILEFGTLAEARTYLKTADADMILLDNRLPDGNGIELATALQADPRYQDTPIIVVTGDDVSVLDFGIAALSKDELNARSLGDVIAEFFKQRRIARGDGKAKLLAELGATSNDSLNPVFSRAVRRLRSARAQVARSAPFAAIHALDEVEDIMVAIAHDLNEKAKAS